MSTEQRQKDEVSVIPRILLGIVNTSYRYPRFVLALAALLMGLSIYLAWARLTFHTERRDLVSSRKDYQQRWQQYVDEFGDDDDMVVVVKGNNSERMKESLEKLALKLKSKPDLFDRVFYKVDLRSLRTRALLYLSTDQIRQIQENLENMSLLLKPPLISYIDPLVGWKSLKLERLLIEAKKRADKNQSWHRLDPVDEQLYTQLAVILESAEITVENPAKYKSPWLSILPQSGQEKDLMAEPHYFFSENKKLAFLLVRPVKNMESFTMAQDSIRQMRDIVSRTEEDYPDLEFGLTGLPVLENDEMVASQMDTMTASWLALAGVTILYLLVYRCVRYPLLTVGTLLVGTIWALGWLTFTIGHLNILSATFAVMLIGLGDYGVLWVTRYEQERSNRADVNEAMTLTTIKAGPSILTAALTTAAAFFTAMFVDFQAVAELGWIAGSGVLLCALACFTVLPALLKIVDKKPPGETIPISFKKTRIWLPGLTRIPGIVLCVAVLLAAVGAFYAFRVRYDHNLLHLQARGLDSVKWELELIEHTAGASWYALSTTTTPEEALALKARFEKLEGVSRVVEVASLVPQDQEMKVVLLKDIQSRLQNLPKRGQLITRDLPDPVKLDRQIDEALLALDPIGTMGKKEIVTRLRTSLMRLQDRINQTDPKLVAKRIRLFEQYLVRDLAEDLHRLRDVSAPKAITVQDLPQGLRERHVGRSGKWLVKVFGKGSLWEFDHLSEFVDQIQQVDPEATGKPFSTLAGLVSMREGFKWAAIYAFFAMVVVLLLDFRNVGHTLVALSPLFIGIILSLGIMGLFGLPLNPANIIALPLILGVGADNGVHVLHDYISRKRGKPYALTYCTGRGIMVAALTTILGFGTLMISHHRGLAGLGLLLTVGVACCMVTALVFLPALLRLIPDRSKANKEEKQILTLPRKAG